MNSDLHPLAIVVPAYKAKFLRPALESLAAQTARGFTVYVGDDASREPIKEIVDDFSDRMPIVYRRFEDNLGGRSLVGQWHRCIAMTREPWIWLFSDDDRADANCVAAFQHALNDGGRAVELFRFDLSIVNSADVEVTRPAAHPPDEGAADLLFAILTDRVRQWRAADHIFSRATFERHGGFQDFPAALFSDSATWIKFSTPRGVRTLPGTLLHWRAHETSVSFQTAKYREEYVEALQLFSAWIEDWIGREHPQRLRELSRENRTWFFKQTSLLCGRLSPVELRTMWSFARRTWPQDFPQCVSGLIGLCARPTLRQFTVMQRFASWRRERRMRRHYRVLHAGTSSNT